MWVAYIKIDKESYYMFNLFDGVRKQDFPKITKNMKNVTGMVFRVFLRRNAFSHDAKTSRKK